MSTSVVESRPRVLVAGGTGFVGRALVRELIASQRFRVRVLSRRGRQGLPLECEVVSGSVLERETLAVALRSVRFAYYLVHALPSDDFERRDALAAAEFARSASEAGLERIVYLGALGDAAGKLSPHVQSRQETGRILRAGTVPVVELRASIVLGAGSAVFELVRQLTERLPCIVLPKGADRRCQPIALRDALSFLVSAVEHAHMTGAPLEIGGPEPLTYAALMRLYAELRGLKRTVLQMPIATPRLSGYWIQHFTSLPARVGRELVLGLGHDSVVRDLRARDLVPLEPLGPREAMQLAISESQTALC